MERVGLEILGEEFDLRNGDGEVRAEQLRTLPETVERRDDGAREDVLENL